MINFKKASQPLVIIIFTKLQTAIVIIQEVKNLTYLLPKLQPMVNCIKFDKRLE